MSRQKDFNMNAKTFTRFASLIAILSLLLNFTQNAQAAPSASALSTGKTVNLAWFYKPSASASLKTLASNFSTFILTKNDEDERNTLAALGVKTPILQYLRLDAIHNPGSCSAAPLNNQVAYIKGDFCSISAKHPDWFMLDTSGKRISNEDGYFMMDPGNAGWRAFWLSRARTMQEQFGWKGVFLDNVEASLGKRSKENAMPVKYKTDASYQAAIQGFLKYLYTGYFKPKNRPMVANIISIRSFSAWFSYLQYLDGAMDEGWGVDWSSGYYDVDEWQSHLAMAEKTQNLGKYGIFVSQGSQGDTARQAFAYASYLLIAKGNAAFRYANYRDYNEAWMYANYNLNLGAPLGPRFKSGAVWKRNFTNGTVTVDPLKHTASIKITK
jgi:hypothetical protein